MSTVLVRLELGIDVTVDAEFCDNRLRAVTDLASERLAAERAQTWITAVMTGDYATAAAVQSSGSVAPRFAKTTQDFGQQEIDRSESRHHAMRYANGQENMQPIGVDVQSARSGIRRKGEVRGEHDRLGRRRPRAHTVE